MLRGIASFIIKTAISSFTNRINLQGVAVLLVFKNSEMNWWQSGEVSLFHLGKVNIQHERFSLIKVGQILVLL